MEFINLKKIRENIDDLSKDWNSKEPFRYIVVNDFLIPEKAEEVLNNYPSPWDGKWDNTTYINQKNKYQKRKFEKDSVFDRVFKELNSREFLQEMERITGIEDLIPDEELFGGGLHQSVTGAFLDVHIDYNIHPKTKQHRRMNIIIYMNKDWKDSYNGQLELWDMDKKEMLDKIAPNFNRMVIFETNQISYHGHPHPLKSPKGISRKSLATYYYSATRPANEIVGEHNTKYVNTEGSKGAVKNIRSAFKALIERVTK